eukprot:9333756-Lingulodinium_polyedra.AAC.1
MCTLRSADRVFFLEDLLMSFDFGGSRGTEMCTLRSLGFRSCQDHRSYRSGGEEGEKQGRSADVV